MDPTRILTTIANPEDQSWIGPGQHGEDCAVSLQLDYANMLAAFPTGIVPSGVEISKAATGRYVLGTPGGSSKPLFLLKSVRVTSGTNPGGAGFWHGVVIQAKVNVIATAAGNSAPLAANHPAIFLA